MIAEKNQISKLSNEELKKEYLAYNYFVNIAESYSINDATMLNAIQDEITNRGGSFENISNITFLKHED